MNSRLNEILNKIEELTSVSWSLLAEDQTFKTQFLQWFNVDKLDIEQIVRNSVDYINNNY